MHVARGGFLLSAGVLICFSGRYRLVWSRTLGSHPSNTGSNPVGATICKVWNSCRLRGFPLDSNIESDRLKLYD